MHRISDRLLQQPRLLNAYGHSLMHPQIALTGMVVCITRLHFKNLRTLGMEAVASCSVVQIFSKHVIHNNSHTEFEI